MVCGQPWAGEEGPSLAAVLRAGLAPSPPSLPMHQWRILNALLNCRSPALGWHRYRCQECGRSHAFLHSCRNRHCPLCQGQAARKWLAQQEEALLPVPYFHLVFTLPHVLNPLIQQNQRVLYNLLFSTVSQTLLEFGRNRFGAQLGITAVLHTWSQTLLDHYHLHCIVTGGGLAEDGPRWVAASKQHLFSVRALSLVFRGKFCAGLEQCYAEGKLEFHGLLEPLSSPVQFKKLLKEAARPKWVVYAKRPFGGPEQVLTYLSRYTHRVAISPKRILDLKGQTVTFAWKDYADAAKGKTMCLDVREFLRRFCLHLLPSRFVKIRHFGFLSNRQRKARVEQIRGLLAKSPRSESKERAGESVTLPSPLCPYCGSCRLILVEVVRPRSHPVARPRRLDSS